MKISDLKYLGLLGLIGLVGLVTANPGFYGFFGFFGFFAFEKIPNDERVHQNLGKAALNSFVFTLVGMSVFIAALAFWGFTLGTAILIPILLGGHLLIFVYSFQRYNNP